nr:hypothetical protein GCM10010200_019240 [Actinomadura rugatobispora]
MEAVGPGYCVGEWPGEFDAGPQALGGSAVCFPGVAEEGRETLRQLGGVGELQEALGEVEDRRAGEGVWWCH